MCVYYYLLNKITINCILKNARRDWSSCNFVCGCATNFSYIINSMDAITFNCVITPSLAFITLYCRYKIIQINYNALLQNQSNV